MNFVANEKLIDVKFNIGFFERKKNRSSLNHKFLKLNKLTLNYLVVS